MTSQKISETNQKLIKNRIDIYLPDMYLADVLSLKAKCYLALYNKTKQLRYLYNADGVYDSYNSFIKEVKQFYQDNQTKYNLNKDIKPVYSAYLSNKLLLYEFTKNKKFLEDAFLLCQEYNAFVLREQVTERMALHEAITDRELKKKFLSLKNDFLNSAFLLQQQYSDSLFKSHMKYKETFENFSDSLKNIFPLLKNIGKSIKPVTVSQVKKELKED